MKSTLLFVSASLCSWLICGCNGTVSQEPSAVLLPIDLQTIEERSDWMATGLEGFAVGDIQGLSMDTGNNGMWVLDATANRIVHVNLPQYETLADASTINTKRPLLL